MRRSFIVGTALAVVAAAASVSSAYTGAVDATFNGDGTVNLGRAGNALLAARSDGSILTVTHRSTRDGVTTTVRATTSDGTPDTSFSGDGAATPRIGAGKLAAVAVDTSDRLLVLTNSRRTVLTRLTSAGRVDRSFAVDGRRLIEDRQSFPTALTIDSRGRAVVLLTTDLEPRQFTSDALVVRVLPGGRLDHTFGRSGVRRIDLGRNDYSGAIDVDNRDRTVVAGASLDSEQIRVFRLTAGIGRLDRSFSGDGVARVRFGLGIFCISTTVQATDAGVTVGGFCSDDGSDPAIAARFTHSGALDPSFGGDGRAALDVGGGDGLAAVAIDDAGAVLAGGFSRTSRSTSDALVGGLLPDGSPDTGFGPRGRATLSIGQGRSEAWPGIVVDGQLVVLVGSDVPNGKGKSITTFHLVRLLSTAP